MPRRTGGGYVEGDSRLRTQLQAIFNSLPCRSGGTGRRTRFRVWRPHGCPGSNPGFGTNSFHPIEINSFSSCSPN